MEIGLGAEFYGGWFWQARVSSGGPMAPSGEARERRTGDVWRVRPSGRLRKWRLDLLNDDESVLRILVTLQDSGKEQVRVGDSRPVHEAITYLQNHVDDMKYAQARRLGLPVGSGIVEAGCKSLYQVRFKRPGCRWKEKTGAHIVELRALALSNRFGPSARLRPWPPLRHQVTPALAPSAALRCAA